MTKVVVMALSEKEARLIEDTLLTAAPHMTPTKKQDVQKLAKKIRTSPRTTVG